MDVDYGDVVEDDTSPSTATSPSSSQGGKDRLRLPRVRLVEVSLVGMALILWAGAIVLFFHRWGKRPFATCRAMRFIERFLLRKNKNAPPLHTRLQGDEEDHLHLRQLLHDAPSPGRFSSPRMHCSNEMDPNCVTLYDEAVLGLSKGPAIAHVKCQERELTKNVFFSQFSVSQKNKNFLTRELRRK